jgi:transcriptional regulator with XRE-family HTH domain
MQAPTWNRELFRETFSQVMDKADLSYTDLAKIGGTSQATVSRWAAGEVKPNYDPLRRFVDALTRRFPKLGDLPGRLLDAAGYGEGYTPAGPARGIEDLRREVAEIKDPARRDRVESMIERTLKEMEEDQRRRLLHLKDVIGLAKNGDDDSD